MTRKKQGSLLPWLTATALILSCAWLVQLRNDYDQKIKERNSEAVEIASTGWKVSRKKKNVWITSLDKFHKNYFITKYDWAESLRDKQKFSFVIFLDDDGEAGLDPFAILRPQPNPLRIITPPLSMEGIVLA